MMVPAATVVVENVTAVRPVTVAVAVFVPTVVPVMNFAAAIPLPSVITVAGATLPLPAVTAKATLTPYAGKFEASITRTRIESEKLAPATTLVGSVPTLVMDAGTEILTVVEPARLHDVRIKAARTGARIGTPARLIRPARSACITSSVPMRAASWGGRELQNSRSAFGMYATRESTVG